MSDPGTPRTLAEAPPPAPEAVRRILALLGTSGTTPATIGGR